MDKNEIIIREKFSSRPEEVWNALTNPAEMKKWYFPMMEDFRPQPGFQTQFNVHHEGKDFLHLWKVREAIVNKRISYEWRYGGFPGNSLLQFDLRDESGQTSLELKHSGLSSFEPEKYPELSKDNFTEGWKQFLVKLKDFLKQG